MKCSNCGFNNPEDGSFCQECGRSILKKEKVEKDHSLHREIEDGIGDVLFTPKKKHSHTPRNILLSIVAFFLIIFVVLVIIGLNENNTTEVTNEPVTNTGTQTTGESKEWQPFTSVEQGFSVSFPGYPTTERIPEEIVEGFTYSGIQYSSSPDDDTAYLVQVADYNILPSQYDNKVGLEGIVNYMTNDGQATLTGSSFMKFLGYDGVDFTLTSKDGYYGKGVAFIRNDLAQIKAFILMVFAKSINSSEYNNFINSFRLN